MARPSTRCRHPRPHPAPGKHPRRPPRRVPNQAPGFTPTPRTPRPQHLRRLRHRLQRVGHLRGPHRLRKTPHVQRHAHHPPDPQHLVRSRSQSPRSQCSDFHVAGVSNPGAPFVTSGHNDHISWGFTSLYGDTQDIYIEKVNDHDQFQSANGWKPIEHVRETIRVRGGNDIVVDVARTDHGPIITPAIEHEQRVLSLRWSAYDPSANSIPLFDIDSASNWTEFRNLLGRWWGPSLNVIYADDQGHIGYQAVGFIPVRDGGISTVPVAAGTHEWQGFVPFDQMPSAEDPRQRHPRHRQLPHHPRRLSLPAHSRVGRALPQRTHLEVARRQEQAHPRRHAHAAERHLLQPRPGARPPLRLRHRPHPQGRRATPPGRRSAPLLGWRHERQLPRRCRHRRRPPGLLADGP